MKFIIKNKKPLALVVSLTLTAFLIYLFIGKISTKTPKEQTVQDTFAHTLAPNTEITIPVSGIIESKNSTVVKAQRVGMINKINFLEGDVISQGEIALEQYAPIANAQYEQADAQEKLTDIQNKATISAKKTQEEIKSNIAKNAKVIADLRLNSNNKSVQEASRGALVSIKSAILQIIQSVDFIDANKPLFTKDGIKQYHEVVDALYGTEPGYFEGPLINNNIKSAKELLSTIEELEKKDKKDSALIQSLGAFTNAQLNALTNILMTGEKDVFEDKNIIRNDATYNEYILNRNNVLLAQKNLQTAITALRNTGTMSQEDMSSQKTNVLVSVADFKEAEKQSTYTDIIALQSDMLALTSKSVAMAELSMHKAIAPFGGVIVNMFVNIGDYVMPGESLFEISNPNLRKIETYIPSSFLSNLAPELPFVDKNGNEIGKLERYSPVATNGSIKVVITIYDNSYQIGNSITGYIVSKNTNPNMFKISRAYIHFDNNGPYILTTNEDRVYVDIVSDQGDYMYIKTNTEVKDEILPAYGITI